jgi:apolipoprotein D and lipocalin family protein
MGRLYWYGIFPLHVLVFRGLLREIAGRAAPAPKIADVSVFTHATVLDATAAAAFHWHEQPGALTALTPRALVRITEHTGGIRDGGRVALSIGVGPARIGWTLRHHEYVPERQFCDTQVRGPFALWRHTHRFDPVSPTRSLYQDRIEFAVCRHHVMNRLATAMLRPLLTLAFAQRHRVVRSSLAADRHRITRRWAAAALVMMMMMLPLAVAHADTPAVRTVAAVDLNRYAGDWFEIARFPNRFQRQCVGDVRAHYARRSDGRIDVVNRCQTAKGGTEARGIARIVDTETFAKLKVRFAPALLSFLPVVWGDYWVIGLAPDYSWAVVGSPDRDYLWILARTPTLDAGALTSAKDAARTNGFDVERLVLTPQSGR